MVIINSKRFIILVVHGKEINSHHSFPVPHEFT